MIIQETLSCEWCFALWLFTRVWSLSSVQTQMGFQITFLEKCLTTGRLRADVVPNTLMLLHVEVHPLLTWVRFSAAFNGTNKLFDFLMRIQVSFQVTTGHKRPKTTRKCTFKWSIFCVALLVIEQFTEFIKRFTAFFTEALEEFATHSVYKVLCLPIFLHALDLFFHFLYIVYFFLEYILQKLHFLFWRTVLIIYQGNQKLAIIERLELLG